MVRVLIGQEVFFPIVRILVRQMQCRWQLTRRQNISWTTVPIFRRFVLRYGSSVCMNLKFNGSEWLPQAWDEDGYAVSTRSEWYVRYRMIDLMNLKHFHFLHLYATICFISFSNPPRNRDLAVVTRDVMWADARLWFIWRTLFLQLAGVVR